jgi:hypothetical protein
MIQIEHPKATIGAVAGAATSCYIGFDWHSALGYAGQIIGILSGLASFAWLAYQFYKSKQPPKSV